MTRYAIDAGTALRLVSDGAQVVGVVSKLDVLRAFLSAGRPHWCPVMPLHPCNLPFFLYPFPIFNPIF